MEGSPVEKYISPARTEGFVILKSESVSSPNVGKKRLRLSQIPRPAMIVHSPLRTRQTPNRQDIPASSPSKPCSGEKKISRAENEILYPTLPTHSLGLASICKGKTAMHAAETAAKPQMPVETSCSPLVKLQKTPSPARPKPTLRRESIRTDHSKTSETWTGDADFCPHSRSPTVIRAPRRTFQAQFQSMSVRQGDIAVSQNPRLQKWLETLDIAATTPAEIEEVDTPPLSPNVETERGSMRRWKRKWETEERNPKCNGDL